MAGQRVNHGIGEGFPAFLLVGAGFVGFDREGGVNQKYALFGPAFKVAAGLRFVAEVAFDFLEDVLQGGRFGALLGHREAEAVGLTWFVVGILAQDNHLDSFKRAAVEGVEDVVAFGENGTLGIGCFDKGGQGGKVRFFELWCQVSFPGIFYLYVHNRGEAVCAVCLQIYSFFIDHAPF